MPEYHDDKLRSTQQQFPTPKYLDYDHLTPHKLVITIEIGDLYRLLLSYSNNLIKLIMWSGFNNEAIHRRRYWRHKGTFYING